MAGAAGGIFKTINGGVTFAPIFDDQPVASIGAIEIAPSNENVLWVGTGEGDPRNSTSFGNGVYRSTDAGRTWTLPRARGQRAHQAHRRAIPRIPTSRTSARSATRGARTKNAACSARATPAARGRKCSTGIRIPAARTSRWSRAIRGRCTPGMYTFRRKPWRFDSGGEGNRALQETDAGDTWQKLSGGGMPTEPMDRIGIGVSTSSPNIVYMITETKTQGVALPIRRPGATWTMVNDSTQSSFRPFYYDDLRVDPNNPNRVFVLASGLNVSDDGGKTFRDASPGVHGDHQALWIDPKNSNRILSGSDGGFQISYDGSVNWEILNTVSFAQFYRIETDNQQPYTICGGLQDNGVWCGPSATTSTRRHPEARLGHGERRRRLLRRAEHRGAVDHLLEFSRRPDLRDQPAQQHQSRDRAVPQRHRVHRQPDRALQVPLQLERADRAVAERSESPVLRRQRAVPQRESRHVVGRDQRRPDDERQDRSNSRPAARSSWTTPPRNSTARSWRSRSRPSRAA